MKIRFGEICKNLLYKERYGSGNFMKDLINTYRAHAISHLEAIQNGNSKKANTACDNLIAVASELINSPDAMLLLSLLEDEDSWVQLCAATHSLKLDEAAAIAKLKQIQELEIPIASTMATYTIQEWQNEELKGLRH